MKKIISISAAVLMLFACVSCGRGNSVPNDGVYQLAYNLTNEFLYTKFGDSYRYFTSPLSTEITIEEIRNDKFQWKYQAENGIFLLESECSIDKVEEFAVEYAKFLYDHELLGRNRIQVLTEFPVDMDTWKADGTYNNYESISTGYYTLVPQAILGDEPIAYITGYLKYDLNSEEEDATEFAISKHYRVDEYLSMYD